MSYPLCIAMILRVTSQVLAHAKFQPLTMRMRAKKETYNNVTRAKVHVITPQKVEFVREGKQMLEEIHKYSLPSATPA